MPPIALALTLLASAAVAAEDPASVALLVREQTIDAARVARAVRDADTLTRATAARVVAVRGVTEALPQVREALAAETDAEAAREQVRALAILGSEDDVALAAKQLARFPSSIDTDFSEAVSRRGAPYATSLYFQHAPSLRHARPFVLHALWGREQLLGATASRLLAANDAAALRTLLNEAAESGVAVDAAILTAALRAPSTEIRSAAIWHLVARQGDVPEEALTAREGASAEEAFGREVLRRMRGAKFEEKPEWLAWLRSPVGRARVPGGKPVRRHLTLGEQDALVDERLAKLPSAAPVPPRTQPLGEPPFRIPIELPPGLAEKIFAKTRCSDSWLGVASVTVDRVGRVQDVATKRVYTSPRCAEVLETLLRLSFADPTRIGAPMSTDQFQVVKGTGPGCFDEAPVDDVPGGELLRAGGNVVAPVVIERVEPQYPRGSFQRRSSGMVMAEAIITRTGCVRDVRVVAQSHAGELNSAAVLALSKWKFKPGTLDGQPVDVLFHLTINFKQ